MLLQNCRSHRRPLRRNFSSILLLSTFRIGTTNPLVFSVGPTWMLKHCSISTGTAWSQLSPSMSLYAPYTPNFFGRGFMDRVPCLWHIQMGFLWTLWSSLSYVDEKKLQNSPAATWSQAPDRRTHRRNVRERNKQYRRDGWNSSTQTLPVEDK